MSQAEQLDNLNRIRTQSHIETIVGQRENALNTCAVLQAELAVRDQMVNDLGRQIKDLTKDAEVMRKELEILRAQIAANTTEH